jgi:hypothetical protein
MERSSCAHSLKDSRGCTQCLGIVPQRVEIVGNEVYVDGKPNGRQVDHERAITARRRAKR